MNVINRIGVLTSGGDAPGMNAAIRAVVRTGISNNLDVFGVFRGYDGMIKGEIKQLASDDVRNIIQRGGTILKSARSKAFRTPEGRQEAYAQLRRHGIDALVVIGGDGTFQGAGVFSKEYDIPVVGLPGTIDNDIFGTDFTIGFDTALNTVVEAVDRIKDTASSHDRLFFIEVMGAEAGFVALHAAIATGAEAVLIPEVKGQAEMLKRYLETGSRRNKESKIILVAEGYCEGGALALSEKLKEDFREYDVRVSVLGHMQRGGSPSAFDRFLASRLGAAAVEALLDDQRSVMVGYVKQEVVLVPFNKTIKQYRAVDEKLLQIADMLTL